ncbi:GRIA3-like protein, partial [Mya arenaria]
VETALTVDAVAVLTTALVQLINRPDKLDILGFRRGELFLHMNCSADPIRAWEKGHLILEQVLNVTSQGMSGNIAFDKSGRRKDYSLDLYHLSYRSKLRK